MNEQIGKELWGLVKTYGQQAEDPSYGDANRNIWARAANDLRVILTRYQISQPRTCGDCCWWEACEGAAMADVGRCEAPRPMSSQGRNLMQDNRDATACDCFERKEVNHE